MTANFVLDKPPPNPLLEKRRGKQTRGIVISNFNRTTLSYELPVASCGAGRIVNNMFLSSRTPSKGIS